MAVIFFDIDGTLALGTEVPPSAADAIGRARAAGHRVFICTGRPPGYARSTFGAYADGFVCCNGRLALLDGEPIIDRPVGPDVVARIRELLDGFDAGYAFFSKDGVFYGGNEAYRSVAEQAHGACGDLGSALERESHLYSYDIYFRDVAEREQIAAALEGLSIVNPHGPHPSADATVTGYGKGDACRDVTRLLGLESSDSYAFGDGLNDISMLRAVGHGIAMGNALPEVKAAAEHVTSDILEDGVARGLERYGLA